MAKVCGGLALVSRAVPMASGGPRPVGVCGACRSAASRRGVAAHSLAMRSRELASVHLISLHPGLSSTRPAWRGGGVALDPWRVNPTLG